VFLDEFGGSLGRRVIFGGYQGYYGGLGLLRGQGDDGDVDIFARCDTGRPSDDPDVVSAMVARHKRFQVNLEPVPKTGLACSCCDLHGIRTYIHTIMIQQSCHKKNPLYVLEGIGRNAMR
jgi:hypothetical protein